MATRRLLFPTMLALAGLTAIVVGWGEAHSDDVTCGGQQMSPGEECEHIDVDTGSSYTNTYEQEQRSQHSTGWFLVGGGVLLFLINGYLLYRRTLQVELTGSLVARRRAALATSQGWTYQAEDSALLRTYQTGPLVAATSPAARNVVAGTANGRPFHVFDYERGERSLTACVVQLPVEFPELQVVLKSRHSPLVYSPTSSGDNVPLRSTIDWAYEVRTVAPQVAERLLIPGVTAHIRKHKLTLAVHGRWLSVIWPRTRDQSRVASTVAAATELANLLLSPPPTTRVRKDGPRALPGFEHDP